MGTLKLTLPALVGALAAPPGKAAARAMPHGH